MLVPFRRVFGQRLVREAQACPFLLCAADFALEPPRQIVLRGGPRDPGNPLLAQSILLGLQPYAHYSAR